MPQSPELAGGEGFTFEGAVAALYLTQLLSEGYAPGIDDRASDGSDLIPSLRSARVAPAAPALAKLRRLHAKAGELARSMPDAFENVAKARGLEQALVESWVACLDTDVEEDSTARRRHSAIMRRFHAFIEAHVDEPLYVPDICRATHVPRRTLNAFCHDALGMGPKKYLLLRRMHLARKALLTAEPSSATVTDIATGLGFFDLGRFAVEYRGLFGETPSVTLRAPAA